MKKLFKYSLIACLGLSMAACTDLEEDLIGDITEDIVVEGINIDGPGSGDGALTALYAELRNAGTANHGGYYSISGDYH